MGLTLDPPQNNGQTSRIVEDQNESVGSAGRPSPNPTLVVGVDGGGSKTEVVALTIEGEVVDRLTGPGSSPHFAGLAESIEVVDSLVRETTLGGEVVQASLFLSGLDLDSEVAEYREALATKEWAQHGLSIENDTFAVLASGTANPNAIAVVCGTGINAVGTNQLGQTKTFYSLGELSGDWGGGLGLGQQALWHAARAADGRGPQTELTGALEEHFSTTVSLLIEQIHLGLVDASELASLVPEILERSDRADPIARMLVERQAEEIVAYVRACTQELGLSGDVDVVLGGSILQAQNPLLAQAISEGVKEVLPDAILITPTARPAVGAALTALRAGGATDLAIKRALSSLT